MLGDLIESIDRTQSRIGLLTGVDGQLAEMGRVEPLQIDQTLPPDEGQVVSREPIPLPAERVLMRQHTPPPDGPGLREALAEEAAAAAAADSSGAAATDAKKVGGSGAGHLVLPEDQSGSRQLPDQS